MKRSFTVALLALLMAVSAQPPAWGIVYGEPDGGRHPNVGAFVATIVNPQTGATELVQGCSGTVVAPDVVLSAAHCFPQVDWILQIWFTLDEVIDANRDGLVDPGVELLSGTAVVHPQFNAFRPISNPYDLAVFRLDQPVGVAPAPLPAAGLLDDRALRDATFVAVGYGLVRESNRKAFQGLSISGQRMMATQHLSSVTKAWVTFSMNLATGNAGTCYGDSGGPHFLGDVVVSVTSIGDAPCKATDKTYRVDTPWARDFLAPYVPLP
jgi:hypothetical protein